MADVSANWRRDHPWAAVYDFFIEREQLNRPFGWLLFGTDTQLLYRTIAAIEEVPEGGAVLDVPCGGGVALRGIPRGRKLRYVAADISPAMLERTASVARERGLDQVETCAADVEDLPFADGEFDLCLSLTGLHCFPRPGRAVEEIARCLRPGGRLVGSMFVTDAGLRYAPLVAAGRAAGVMGPSGGGADLERWLSDAGLKRQKIQRSGALAYFSAER